MSHRGKEDGWGSFPRHANHHQYDNNKDSANVEDKL